MLFDNDIMVMISSFLKFAIMFSFGISVALYLFDGMLYL